jgi:cysteinyl-tRNA synthetase
MEFYLTNTQTGEKERLYAADGSTLRFYCCGPTVYGPAHIGNFRTFTIQDVFRRTAESLGFATRHVRNLTDIDDKTIRSSQAAGESLQQFTDRWTARFTPIVQRSTCSLPTSNHRQGTTSLSKSN